MKEQLFDNEREADELLTHKRSRGYTGYMIRCYAECYVVRYW